MSKRKQEAVNSDLASQRPLALPSTVVGSNNPEIADETGMSRHKDISYRNRDAYFIEERKEAKVSSRRAQLVALSKFVNKAFTGWTIKTQS